jgi:hypothetical protein
MLSVLQGQLCYTSILDVEMRRKSSIVKCQAGIFIDRGGFTYALQTALRRHRGRWFDGVEVGKPALEGHARPDAARIRRPKCRLFFVRTMLLQTTRSRVFGNEILRPARSPCWLYARTRGCTTCVR